jgi:hypothetical protein
MTGLTNIIFTMKNGNCPEGKKQQSLCITEHPLGNNDVLILTRVPSQVMTEITSPEPLHNDQPGHICDRSV